MNSYSTPVLDRKDAIELINQGKGIMVADGISISDAKRPEHPSRFKDVKLSGLDHGKAEYRLQIDMADYVTSKMDSSMLDQIFRRSLMRDSSIGIHSFKALRKADGYGYEFLSDVPFSVIGHSASRKENKFAKALHQLANSKPSNFSDEEIADLNRIKGELLMSIFDDENGTSMKLKEYANEDEMKSALKSKEDFINYINGVVAFEGSPRTLSMGEIRRLCDLMGLVLIPVDYANLNCDEITNDKKLEESVNNFISGCKVKKCQTYIVAFPQYYSVISHMKSKDINAPIYMPEIVKPTFDQAMITMPALQMLWQTVSELDKRVDKLEGSLNNIAVQFNKRLSELEHKVDGQIVSLTSQIGTLRREIEQERLRAIDPMLICVPDASKVESGNIECEIGPVWGPEFSMAALVAAEIPIHYGQSRNIKGLYGLKVDED